MEVDFCCTCRAKLHTTNGVNFHKKQDHELTKLTILPTLLSPPRAFSVRTKGLRNDSPFEPIFGGPNS